MQPITEELLKSITHRLVDQFQPEQVILFGSYAWGEPTADSDVDLMVIVGTSRLSDYQRAVLGHRCLSGLGLAKDVIVRTREEFDRWKAVRSSLEYKVARHGKVLYEQCQDSASAKLANQGAA
jgi:predicted nucleotidyltransferase